MANEIKKEENVAVPAAEVKAPAEKKKAVKKSSPKKPATKKPAEKAIPASDKAVVQFAGKADIDVDTVIAAAKTHYSELKKKKASNVVVYIKPEEKVAYYTVNGKGSDEYKVEI